MDVAPVVLELLAVFPPWVTSTTTMITTKTTNAPPPMTILDLEEVAAMRRP